MILFSLTTKTPLGNFHMIAERWTDTKGNPVDVVRASGFGSLAALRNRLPPEFRSMALSKDPGTDSGGKSAGVHPYQKAVAAYFKGDARALFSIRSAQSGNAFSEKAWQAIAAIPFGKTISYQELAARTGNAKAVRAAGTACGANSLILLVPCHRVIRADGSLGEYVCGQKRKKALLQHELLLNR